MKRKERMSTGPGTGPDTEADYQRRQQMAIIQYNLAHSSPANEILRGVWLGGLQAALDGSFLKAKNIQVVFNCTKESHYHPFITRRYQVPIDDNLREEEIRALSLVSFETITKLALEVKSGRAVLVHCMAGMQRSAAIMAMFLIAIQGMSWDAARNYIQSRRPIAFRPAANFERAIREFEAAYHKMMETDILARPYSERGSATGSANTASSR